MTAAAAGGCLLKRCSVHPPATVAASRPHQAAVVSGLAGSRMIYRADGEERQHRAPPSAIRPGVAPLPACWQCSIDWRRCAVGRRLRQSRPGRTDGQRCQLAGCAPIDRWPCGGRPSEASAPLQSCRTHCSGAAARRVLAAPITSLARARLRAGRRHGRGGVRRRATRPVGFHHAVRAARTAAGAAAF